jgi:pimeloyl-ACP methyl ester carboxylesterase
MTLFRDGYYESGGLKLHYVEGGQPAGTAPLILFYHGFPSFWYSFHLQMEHFAKDFHVVAVDGPGANLSDQPGELEPYKVVNLAAQIDGLARHLIKDAPFYLVGHDWGGALSWAFAQGYPQRLKKVVVLSAPPVNQLLHLLRTDEVQAERSSYMYAMRSGKLHAAMTANNNQQVCEAICTGLRRHPHYTEAMEAEFRKGLSVPGAIDAGINWYRANVPPISDISDTDAWPSHTASTDVPALLIWGEDDDTFVASFIDDLPQYATNLTVCRFAGVGHSPMLEQPAETNAAIREFITGEDVPA